MAHRGRRRLRMALSRVNAEGRREHAAYFFLPNSPPKLGTFPGTTPCSAPLARLPATPPISGRTFLPPPIEATWLKPPTILLLRFASILKLESTNPFPAA